MKAYSKYKDVSLPWLSAIPSHWDVIRNKVILTESKETVGSEHSNYQLLSLTRNGVIVRDITNGKGKFPSDFSSYKIVNEGQIIFCLFDIEETPRTIGISKHDGMITGAYDIFSIKGTNPVYLEYYYISLDDVKAMSPLYTGLRKTIGINTFMQTLLPRPPRPEQDQIVRFLDWKVSKINKLINVRKKQIRLLQEKRKAVINKTVNEQKEHIKFKYLLTIKSGEALINSHLSDNNVYPVYGGGKLIGYYHEYNVCKDNILLGRVGANCGCVTRLESNAFATDNALVVTTKHNLDYIEYLLTSANLNSLNESNAQPLITGYKVLNFSTRYSSDLQIQNAIVSYLDQKVSTIDKIIDKLSDEIKLFTEYRIRLISDVVTGKLDVRDVVVPEFEKVED